MDGLSPRPGDCERATRYAEFSYTQSQPYTRHDGVGTERVAVLERHGYDDDQFLPGQLFSFFLFFPDKISWRAGARS
jgi:hypothetical protein